MTGGLRFAGTGGIPGKSPAGVSGILSADKVAPGSITKAQSGMAKDVPSAKSCRSCRRGVLLRVR